MFDNVAKEVLRQQIWKVAEFCGLEVITYTILSNHFHVLVRVPRLQPISDAELLRRHRVLHAKPSPYQVARLEVIERELAGDGPEAAPWRRRQLALMGDVSPFMKLLKQRFSIWFNKAHGRFGTLWAERFKSVLLEAKCHAVRSVAAYIDLNGVRAGLASDPKEYRFCGYAEAVAGKEAARRGIASAVGPPEWPEAQARYRELLFGAGVEGREGKAAIADKDLRRVCAEGGRLTLSEVLRCRIRYFTEGAVLGSHAFVQARLAALRRHDGRAAPRALPSITDWGDLAALRGPRGQTGGL